MLDTDSPAARLGAALDRIHAQARAPSPVPEPPPTLAPEIAARLDKLIAQVREALDAEPQDA